MSPSYWNGRRVLVTGVTGFKGSWLALLLGRLGARVSGYSLEAPTKPSLFQSARVEQDIEWVRADVRDLARLAACLAEHRPEVVFHLAAQPLVRASYEDPAQTFGTNVMGTVNVLEAARATHQTRAIVVVTSDKCYEDAPRATGYVEADRLGGADPYSASKACAELVARSYRQSFFASGGPVVVTARAGNVIGGGDWARDRIVPDLITAIGSSRTAVIRNPSSVRPWQHVLDPLAGYLLLAERAVRAGHELASAWNFGPDASAQTSVSELADEICRLWGPAASWRAEERPGPRESSKLTLDSSRARAHLGWCPTLDRAQAITWTTGWYRRVLTGEDARTATLEQIDQYRRLAA